MTSACSLSITVSRDQPTRGFFASLSGFILGTNGVYSLSSVTATQATAALRALIWVPTADGRLAPHGSETNRLTIAVNDGFAPTVTDTNTTVISVDSFVKEITTSNGVSTVSFGYAVSANRDLVLIGAPTDSGAVSQSGASYLFSRNLGGNDAWGQLRKLQASDGVKNDMFGYSVSLSGDTLVVGAPSNTNRIGAVYIFDRNTNGPNAWGQSKKLVPPDGSSSDRFGAAVAIYGDTIIVGSYQNKPGTIRTGSAYVYGRNQGGVGQWGLVKKILPGDGADSDSFGWSVALNGDTAVVGSQANAGLVGSKAGAAYVFDRNQGGANQWGLTKKLVAADGTTGARFGYAVGISGDLIISGAPYDDPGSVETGSAYVFGRNQGGTNQWGQVNKFLPFDGRDGDEFGFSVTIDGELMAVSSHLDYDGSNPGDDKAGAVYVYARNYPGLSQWSLLEKLVPAHFDDDNDDGFVISLSQSTLAVGTHFTSGQTGHSYIYRLKYNNAPYVAQPIPDQVAVVNTPFTFNLPGGTFADPDIGDTLTLSLSFFPPPPAWLNFNPATTTFSGIPDLVGSYPVVVRATDPDGASVTANFNIVVPGSAPVPKSVKSLWRTSYFSAQVLADPSLEATVWGDSADPDGDGVNNLQEYIFGTNPLQANPGDTSPVSITPGLYPDTISLTFRRRTNDQRLIYTPETCNDFNSWQSVDAALIIEEATIPMGPGLEQVTQQIQVPTPADLPQFFRVKAIFLIPDLP